MTARLKMYQKLRGLLHVLPFTGDTTTEKRRELHSLFHCQEIHEQLLSIPLLIKLSPIFN